MSYYKFRLDVLSSEESDVLEKVRLYSKVYCLCIEGGLENRHLHMLLWIESGNQANNLRTCLRKLGYKGNGSYSLKNCEEENQTDFPLEYVSYMMKENEFKNYLLTTDQVKLAKEHSLKVKNEIKDKKAKRLPVWKKIMEELLKVENISSSWWPDKAVIRFIYKYHIDNGLSISSFRIQSYYDTIKYSVCGITDDAINDRYKL